MREYKFRVWDKDTKHMHICGDDVHDEIDFEYETNKAYYYNLQNGCGSLREDSSYVLMQYTGLHDKNGKEIYENMIINNKYIVIYNFCKFALKNKDNGEIIDFERNKDYEITGEYFK